MNTNSKESMETQQPSLTDLTAQLRASLLEKAKEPAKLELLHADRMQDLFNAIEQTIKDESTEEEFIKYWVESLALELGKKEPGISEDLDNIIKIRDEIRVSDKDMQELAKLVNMTLEDFLSNNQNPLLKDLIALREQKIQQLKNLKEKVREYGASLVETLRENQKAKAQMSEAEMNEWEAKFKPIEAHEDTYENQVVILKNSFLSRWSWEIKRLEEIIGYENISGRKVSEEEKEKNEINKQNLKLIKFKKDCVAKFFDFYVKKMEENTGSEEERISNINRFSYFGRDFDKDSGVVKSFNDSKKEEFQWVKFPGVPDDIQKDILMKFLQTLVYNESLKNVEKLHAENFDFHGMYRILNFMKNHEIAVEDKFIKFRKSENSTKKFTGEEIKLLNNYFALLKYFYNFQRFWDYDFFKYLKANLGQDTDHLLFSTDNESEYSLTRAEASKNVQDFLQEVSDAINQPSQDKKEFVTIKDYQSAANAAIYSAEQQVLSAVRNVTATKKESEEAVASGQKAKKEAERKIEDNKGELERTKESLQSSYKSNQKSDEALAAARKEKENLSSIMNKMKERINHDRAEIANIIRRFEAALEKPGMTGGNVKTAVSEALKLLKKIEDLEP